MVKTKKDKKNIGFSLTKLNLLKVGNHKTNLFI